MTRAEENGQPVFAAVTRYGAALGIGVLLTVHAGCGAETATGLRVCGQFLRTGADQPVIRELTTGGPPADLPTAPPRRSVLPPRGGIGHHTSDAEYVRVSPSCRHGATVVVTPAKKTRLVRIVRAGDGRPVLIALFPPREAVVRAWVGGRYQGVLDPGVS